MKELQAKGIAYFGDKKIKCEESLMFYVILMLHSQPRNIKMKNICM